MTVTLPELWLPILLGTVLAWIASMLIHIVLKYHNGDYQALSNEDEVAAAIRAGQPGKGVHSMPYCIDMKEMGSEAMQKKFNDGPVAFVTIFDSGMPPMPKLIGQQILFFLFGIGLVAYCVALSVPPGADYLVVFRNVASVGFLAFGWGQVPFSIWYGHPWSTTAKYLLDALIYSFVVAGVFAWLWPAAT